ncbi:phosphonate ABC transporter ATP-binding protein [Janthinobacterium sp. B9-8]|uniref:phosphonate ABC transporter ATP-binding protein n=1 Tax=Janthinobacterium sp. B9-8 TaxID=1236179 RepID=UPI00061D1751|nr:ATP-binding cassette domain-containing protein [Janthinobacterium sp. B9-8]AMC33176.1 phosphonate ABC transporter [Janthinobacterium sp. B9-8]
MFQLQQLSLTLGATCVLNNITLAATQGEQIALIGPSGAGKSSLLRLLGTHHAPNSGELRLLDQNPWLLDRRRLQQLRSRIGMAYQAPPLPGKSRVITAVAAGRLGRQSFAQSLLALAYPQDIAGIRAVLEQVQLADKLFVACDTLSGGQLQRVGLARVLYQAPDLILADEPVSALDPVLADKTIDLLTSAAQARQATLLTSLHSVDLALKFFPRIVGIRQGQIQFDLPSAEVSPTLLDTLYAGESNDPSTPPAASLPRGARC